MRLYIDKANIESFVQSSKSEPERFAKCNLMLKKHFDMHLNVSQDDFASSRSCMEWANLLLDGRGKNVIFFDGPASVYPKRPIVSDTFGEGFDKHASSAIYLLNDTAMDAVENHGNYLAAGVGKELETLSQLMIGDEEEPYTQSLPLKKYFASGDWHGLDKAILPCSDIIISDPYILSDYRLYEKNILAMLRKVTSLVALSSVNIVIFCLNETTSKSGQTFAPRWNQVRRQIKDKLNEEQIDANVTFVAYKSDSKFQEHDRTMCTNYLYYMPAATLNFYDSQGNFTSHGRHMMVYSLAKSDHYDEASDYLQDMQNMISEIENDGNKGMINKDSAPKLSNLLTFS